MSYFIRALAVAWLMTGLLSAAVAHSPHHVITDVAVAKLDGENEDVFIVIADQLFRSDRHGAAWKNLINGLDNQHEFTDLVVSPGYASEPTLFVATSGNGVYRSIDGGQSWHAAGRGLEKKNVSALSISRHFAADGRVLAAGAHGGAWVLDADDQWRMVLTENARLTAIAEDMSTTARVVAGDEQGELWQSTDNGRLWARMPSNLASDRITALAVSGNEILVGSAENGAYRSVNGGQSFDALHLLATDSSAYCPGADPDGSISSQFITDLGFLPTSINASGIFVTTWYSGVHVSDDAGLSWSRWDRGLACDEQADAMSSSHFKRVVSTQVDGNSDLWLASFNGLYKGRGANPVWQQLETLPLGLIKGMAVSGSGSEPAIAIATYGGGFYLTSDRGRSWTIGNRGLQTTRLTGLAFSPDYATNGVLYAGASRRLLRSDDRGESWQRIELRVTSFGRSLRNRLRRIGMPAAWFADQHSAQIYPTVLRMPSQEDEVLFATRFDGLMRYRHASGNFEFTWPGTRDNINTFEIAPVDSGATDVMLASIRGQGVIRSDDGGSSWQSANSGLDFVETWKMPQSAAALRQDVILAISPAFSEDGTVFAGSPGGEGLYKSVDGGRTWTMVPGPFATVPLLAIAVSPQYAVDRSLLVSVRGHGLFRSEDGAQTFSQVGGDLRAANASLEWLEYSAGFARDRVIIGASDESLFLSEDAGLRWTSRPHPVRYEDMRNVVTFSGDAERVTGEQYSARTETHLSGPAASATLNFVGDGIRWIGSRGPRGGSGDVYIDGELRQTVNTQAPTESATQTLFAEDSMEFGAHSIEIRMNGAADQNSVPVDAFDVLRRPAQAQ